MCSLLPFYSLSSFLAISPLPHSCTLYYTSLWKPKKCQSTTVTGTEAVWHWGALTLGEWVSRGGCLGLAPMVTSLRRATHGWARTLIQCSVTPVWSSPQRTRRSWSIWTLTPSTPSPTPTPSTSQPVLRDSSTMRSRWVVEVYLSSSRALVPSPCLASCVAGHPCVLTDLFCFHDRAEDWTPLP